MPTPAQVLALNVGVLNGIGANAGRLSAAVDQTSSTLHRTLHDNLAWTGDAVEAAQGKADRERTQLRGVSHKYDDLASACGSCAAELEHPIAQIKDILTRFAVAPVVVADDWSVSGVDDWNSPAGIELSRLAGLATTVTEIDQRYSRQISQVAEGLADFASATAMSVAKTNTSKIVDADSRADPERLRASSDAFERTIGRPPVSPTDWATAEVLNEESYDPKYKGVDANVVVTKIEPVPGQGVVRTSHFIQERDVSDPSLSNLVGRNKGDNRKADSDFDPEHARVVTYIDYENGLVVMRQNPSVVQEADGSSGHVETGVPRASVLQADDGSVRIRYNAADPIGLGGPTRDLGWSVNGDLVATPTADGVKIDGTRTNYPWFEAYQSHPDGRESTISVDPPDGFGTGSSLGPSINLQMHHEIGAGVDALHDDKWKHWVPQYDVTVEAPGVPMGDPDNAPSAAPVPHPGAI